MCRASGCRRWSACWKFLFSSRRRHTRCSRDWSSDVCSSDLSWSFSRGAPERASAAAAGCWMLVLGCFSEEFWQGALRDEVADSTLIDYTIPAHEFPNLGRLRGLDSRDP